VPALGVGLLILAFLINLPSNTVIGNLSKLTAVIKVLGVAIFAGAGLWVSGGSSQSVTSIEDASVGGFLAATAIGVLAYKGFTTITNSGDEVTEPKKNIGRAITISLLICVVLYLLVGFAVAGGLSVEEVIKAKDYALAEAARPILGRWGVWFTVGIAIIATVSGVIASVFAVSRMLAMLTDMELVPHRHFGMPGRIQKHTLVYTIILAIILTIFLDLSRIAAIGAIFYIIMDMAVHWGVLRHLRSEVNASMWVLVLALVLDSVVLTALCTVKATTDPLVLFVSGVGIALIFGGEFWFFRKKG
jgi:amino acid transporter